MQIFKIVSFGSSKANLATVGYQLYGVNGAASGSRITAGVKGLGGGQYGASVTIPDDFAGRITWDTGESSPAYASEEMLAPTTPTFPTVPTAANIATAVWTAQERTLTGEENGGGETGWEASSVANIVGEPVWNVQMLSRDWAPATESEHIVLLLNGQAGPYRLLDNTGYPVEIALVPLTDGQTPTSGTIWYDAARQPDGTSRVTIGPNEEEITLTAGVRYRVFARIASGGKKSLLLAGYLLAR